MSQELVDKRVARSERMRIGRDLGMKLAERILVPWDVTHITIEIPVDGLVTITYHTIERGEIIDDAALDMLAECAEVQEDSEP